MKYQNIIDLAFEAMKHAYAPYSNYYVGSCVLTKDGKIFTGANIENASFGATSCGERNAIFACYSAGYRAFDIEAIAIVSSGEKLAAPCGICRQVLNELLDKKTPIILSNKVTTKITTIEDLLPFSFTSEDLNGH